MFNRILGDLCVSNITPKVIISGIKPEELENAKTSLREKCFKSQISGNNIVVYDGCDREYMRKILLENNIILNNVSFMQNN